MLYSKTHHSNRCATYEDQANRLAYHEAIYTKLAQYSVTRQWILFTAETERPNRHQLATYHVVPDKVIQLKKSQTLSEYEVVKKAILSGNACAIVLSDQLLPSQRTELEQLALLHRCELLFHKNSHYRYH